MKEIKHQLESTLKEGVDKNYYAISFASNGCNFEVLVNDVPVYRYFKEGGATGSYPINSWILKSGEQKIKVKLYPVRGHEEKGINAEYPLGLTVKYKSDPGQGLYDYVDLLSDFIPRIEPGTPYFEYETVFHAEVPYEMPGWTDCKDLRNMPDLKTEVIRKYRQIGEVIIRKDFDKLGDMLAAKFAEIGVSMYMTDEAVEEEMTEMFEEMEEYTGIVPMESYQVRICGDGRLVVLEDPEKKSLGFKIENEEYTWPQLLILGIREGRQELEVVQ